jgi:hypothetical protein
MEMIGSAGEMNQRGRPFPIRSLTQVKMGKPFVAAP